MKFVKLLIVVVTFTLLYLSQTQLKAQSSVVLFQDDFNRADNASLGALWQEENEGLDYYVTSDGKYMAPAFLEVRENSFAFHTTSHPSCTSPCNSVNPHPYAFAPLAQAATGLPLEISSTIQPHRGERIGQVMGLMNSESNFRSFDTPPYDYYLPVQGIGIMVFRTGSVSNSRMAIYQFSESDDLIILAEESLPFQIEENHLYEWKLLVDEELIATATIESDQGSFSISTEAIDIPHPLDQLYMSTISPETGETGHSEEPYILEYDDLLVTQDSKDLCDPMNDEKPSFCPPLDESVTIFLPVIYGCDPDDFFCLNQ